MLVEHSEAFEFVLSADDGVSVENARKVTVGSQSSVSVLFPIRPLALGEMEISSTLLSADTSESLVQTVLVKVPYVLRLNKALLNNDRAGMMCFRALVRGFDMEHAGVCVASVSGGESYLTCPSGLDTKPVLLAYATFYFNSYR